MHQVGPDINSVKTSVE